MNRAAVVLLFICAFSLAAWAKDSQFSLNNDGNQLNSSQANTNTNKLQTITIKAKRLGDNRSPAKEDTLIVKEYQPNSVIKFDSSNFKVSNSINPTYRDVVVSASLSRTNLSVLYQNTYILSDSADKSDFSVVVKIPKKTNTAAINLTIIDLDGNIKNERFWFKYE